MIDRIAMLEAALDLMDEGVAVLDERSNLVFWNKAAASLTGHRCADLLSLPCPQDLYRVDQQHVERADAAAEARLRSLDAGWDVGFSGALAGYTDATARPQRSGAGFLDRPTLVAMRHQLGHTVPAMLRKIPLNGAAGLESGAALIFYPVEEMDALPHGETGAGVGLERSQADMEDRLDAAHHQWLTSRVPFGLLWLTVDQAAQLRSTHGRDACEAMLRIVEQRLLRGMRPTEVIGRWGNDEFLVLSHERTPELLLDHARRLLELAQTAEFHWWGDRIALTTSIGASQALERDTLQQLLQRTRQAMQTSKQAGGNHVTEARGQSCSQ